MCIMYSIGYMGVVNSSNKTWHVYNVQHWSILKLHGLNREEEGSGLEEQGGAGVIHLTDLAGGGCSLL